MDVSMFEVNDIKHHWFSQPNMTHQV